MPPSTHTRRCCTRWADQSAGPGLLEHRCQRREDNGGGVTRLMLAAPVFQERKCPEAAPGKCLCPPCHRKYPGSGRRRSPDYSRRKTPRRNRFPRKCTALPSNAAPPGHPQRIRYAAAPRCPSLRFAPAVSGRDGREKCPQLHHSAPSSTNMAADTHAHTPEIQSSARLQAPWPSASRSCPQMQAKNRPVNSSSRMYRIHSWCRYGDIQTELKIGQQIHCRSQQQEPFSIVK